MSAPVPLLLISWLAGAERGGQVNLLRLVARLDRARFRPTVVVPGPGTLEDALAPLGCEVAHIDFRAPPVRAPWRAVKLVGPLLRLRALIAKLAPAVIYVDEPSQVGAVHLARAGLAAPLVWHVQAAVPSGHDRWNARFADAIVTVSDPAEARLSGAGGAPRFRIPNAVDLERFAPGEEPALRASLGVGPAETAFLFVGSLSLEKGVPDLLEAFGLAAPSCPGARLWLAGPATPAQTAACEEAIARRSLGLRVRLLGVRSDVERLLRAADAFVLPSHSEGLSLSLLEAMASGRAFVATEIPGNRDLLASGGGLAVPPRDPAALAAALGDLARDPARRALLGERARAHAARHHSIDAYAAAFARLFESLARGGPPSLDA